MSAKARLTEERKQWRKDHPVGFSAKPITNPDNSLNIMIWLCAIPGKVGTIWEGGLYKCHIIFSEEYPSAAPTVQFTPGFFHPNVFDSGEVCLSIIGDDWKPSISVKQIVMGVQELLDAPNPKSPAQATAFNLFEHNKTKYNAEVKKQALKYPADLDE